MLEKRVEKTKGYKTSTINLKPDLRVIGKCNTLPSACLTELIYNKLCSAGTVC